VKKIANFTQTYNSGGIWSPGSDGNDREFLIDYFLKDKNKINSILELDIATFSFHGVAQERSKQLADKIKQAIPKAEFLVYQNMTFAKTILTHLQFLKAKNITDFLWVQDDEFFTHNSFKDFKNVLDFYKQNDSIKHLNLLYSFNKNVLKSEYSINKNVSFENEIVLNNKISVFEIFADQISPSGAFEMDLTCFLCNIDYFLENIFSEDLVYILNAYELESGLRNNAIKNNIQRCFTNISFFESFNIVGMPPSLGNKEKAKTKLVELYK